jgi:hypothetical protein
MRRPTHYRPTRLDSASMEELRLPLTCRLTPLDCATCCGETLSALLFLRSQTPSPLTELQSTCAGLSSVSRRSSAQRAALKLVGAVAEASVPAAAFPDTTVSPSRLSDLLDWLTRLPSGGAFRARPKRHSAARGV